MSHRARLRYSTLRHSELTSIAVRLLKSLNRHVFRPAHLHMMFVADGYEPLVTALYFKGDPYLVG